MGDSRWVIGKRGFPADPRGICMHDLKEYPISLREAYRAQQVVRRHLEPTPLVHNENLSRYFGAQVLFKHENRNPTGTFKIRGGINLLHHLSRQNVGGVITFSTGNHGLSIAAAAAMFSIPTVVVVPENNNPVKNRAILETGAELVESGKTFEEAGQTVDRLCEERGLYFAHPANEPLLINGVGTEFLEILAELPRVDVMIVPLGAGSESAAAITVLKHANPQIKVIAVQAAASPAAYNSWKQGKIVSAGNTTFAGGVATGTAYRVPFEIYSQGLEDFLLLEEEEIYQSIGLVHHYTRDLVEGAGGMPLMTAWKLRERLRNRTVVLQASGGNASADEIRRAVQMPAFELGFAGI